MSCVESSLPIPIDAQCLSCRYCLVGLSEPRCPECGRIFDPSDHRTFLDSNRRNALIVLAGELWQRHRRRVIWTAVLAGAVLLSWVLFEWLEESFSFLFWVPTAWLAFRRQWARAALAMICSPAIVLLLMQCREYAHGGSRYVRGPYNMIQSPQGSLKPDTRVRGFDPGCGTHSSNYWLRYWADRQAIPIMHFIMGPPPGAYRGPYPTLDESLTALESGAVLPKSQVESGHIIIGGKAFSVDSDQLDRWGYVIKVPDPAPVKAAVYHSGCVIVRVPRSLQPRCAAVYLFDAVTGQCFAVYWDEDVISP